MKLRFLAPSAGIVEVAKHQSSPCHDTQVVAPYRVSNPLRLTVLAAKSEDYTTAPQHFHDWLICLKDKSVVCIIVDYSGDYTFVNGV